MFTYYGAKTGVEHFYPKPIYNKIIEPFAGSAKYSLYHFEKDVLLVDCYEDIIKVWHFLQSATPKDILTLPIPKSGEFLSDFNFDCKEAKMLMGFIIGFGSTSPRNKVSPHFSGKENKIKNTLIRISKNLFKIRHWEIKLMSYECLKNENATWFIDPPYQYGGHCYKHSNKNIDFESLAKWCTSRNGQVIVCENTKANWLPFKPMFKATNRFITTEAIYTNQKNQYNNIQLDLF